MAEAEAAPAKTLLEDRERDPTDDEKPHHQKAEATISSTNTSSALGEQQLLLTSHDHEALLLTQLAKQLEYYFSQQNLSKDTYLQTLRNLNDGCVPVTILANFANVKALLPVDDEEWRIHAVIQAASEYSNGLLQVHAINIATGKKIATDEMTMMTMSSTTTTTTILAIGPATNEPLSTVSPDRALSPTAFVSNTVILRDVHAHVTDDEVRAVFDFEGCPAIHSIHCDVSNCWFVTLDTTSRDDMMRVMMQLRSKTLAGEVFQARLKASTAASAPLMTLDVITAQAEAMVVPKKKKKRKVRSKKKKKKNGGASAVGKAAPEPKPSKKATAPPLSFGEDHFPTLQDKKVEWEMTPVTEDEEAKEDGKNEGEDGEDEPKSSKAFSDTASTATTTSSSTESMPKKSPMSGYAAALLKMPAPKTEPPVVKEASKTAAPVSAKVAEKQESHKEDVEPAPVVVTPPSWGGGRSFADILRTEKSVGDGARPASASS